VLPGAFALGLLRDFSLNKAGRDPEADIHCIYEQMFKCAWFPPMPVTSKIPDDSCDVFHLEAEKVSALKRTLLSDSAVTDLAETFKALGDTTRVRILDALSRAELCVCDIARLLGLSESAVSHQLRLLRGMRLVRPRRDGRMIYYTLDDQHIVGLFEQGLEHVQERLR
jgi:ArsR family transcriptional regulator, lead/cadmium/zinc/bismuth-responsive transcriptional repressor